MGLGLVLVYGAGDVLWGIRDSLRLEYGDLGLVLEYGAGDVVWGIRDSLRL